MFTLVLKQWFWDCYDHLGRLLVANLLLFFLLFGSLFMGNAFLAGASELLNPPQIVLLTALFLILLGPVWLTLWFAPFRQFGTLVSAEKDPPFRMLLASLIRSFPRCWKYFQINMLIITVLLVNIWFYVASGIMPEGWRLFSYILAGLCFWIIVIVVVAMVPGIALLLRQDRSIGGTFKRSFLVLFAYPGLTIGMAVFIVSLWIIGAAIRLAGLLIFGFSGVAMLINSYYDVLMHKETEKERLALKSQEGPPRTWEELKKVEGEEEHARLTRARYDRTFRDLIRPWEG